MTATLSCPVCGGGNLSAVPNRPRGEHPLASCADCRVWLVDPLPTPEFLRKFYEGSYYEPWRGQEFQRRRLWRRRLRLLRDLPRGRLLDVGCAEGDFLQGAAEAGFRCAGTEFSEYGAAQAEKKLGVPVYAGELYDLDPPESRFDLITLWHVLEHTTEPGRVLEAAFRLLGPGGRLAIAVPNRSNRFFRMFYLLVRRRPLLLYRSDDREQHLFHWSPEALARAVRHAGFTVNTLVPDPCAVGPGKALVDLFGRMHSKAAGSPRTNAMLLLADR